MESDQKHRPKITIIGGGPAGLIAAETLGKAGMNVTVYDRKPSLGRKFLMAGRGGLNLTHSEPLDTFLKKYGTSQRHLEPFIKEFSPTDLRAWCEDLGQETFIGSSGRIFPKAMKASPLLRAWVSRLEDLGVQFALNHEWAGWNDQGHIIFKTQTTDVIITDSDATVLALGGGSWAKLGSDGGWVDILQSANIQTTPLQPANCGFTVQWSEHFRSRFAGQPIKTIAVSYNTISVPGELMITQNGVEGGAIYAIGANIRAHLPATITIDLKPGLTPGDLARKLDTPRGSQSFSTYLQKTINLTPAAINMLRECCGDLSGAGINDLVRHIKAVPLALHAPFPMDRAISTAGGVSWDAVNHDLMITNHPGVFVAGEMLDWEAPTGGYLLQACFSTGIAAAAGIQSWLAGNG